MPRRPLSNLTLLFIVTTCFSLGFITGVFAYRAYVHAMVFRTAPQETHMRPQVQGPKPIEQTTPTEPMRDDERYIEAPPIQLATREDGIHIWEAEWVNRMTGTFACLASDDTSGNAALWVREGTGRNNQWRYTPPQHPYVDMGVADWWFDLPKAGRYRLYMRVWALDKCGNSCWVGFNTDTNLRYFPGGDNGTYGARNYYNWPDTMFRRWLWIEDEGIVYNLNAGTNRLHIEVREDGFAIDQIALVPLGAKEPVGILQPTLRPLPPQQAAGVAWSTSQANTRKTPTLTPFDVFLAADHHLLYPATSPTTTGALTLRLNVAEPIELAVMLDAGGGDLSPGDTIICKLSPESPVARIPLSLCLPPDSPLRVYNLKARVTAPKTYPDLNITRQIHVERPLEWWALGPLMQHEDRAVGRVLYNATTLDITNPPLPSRPKLVWTRARAAKHFDTFGALDLNELLGEQENRTAYIATRIDVAKSGAYRLLAAGDDQLRLRLDGKLLMNNQHNRPLTDNLQSYPVRLTKGDHLLIGRITQSGRWWQTFVQFLDAEGKPTGDIVGVSLQ